MAGKKGTRKPKLGTPRTCPYGHAHHEGDKGAMVVPSLLDPTVYLCSRGCYDRWCAEHPLPATMKERRFDPDAELVREPGPPLPL